MKKIRVIVLDDSLFVREAARRELERDCNISVVGSAATPYEARDLIVALQPDVLLCDVYLGQMNGIEFVKKLLPQYYIPVIFISSDMNNKAACQSVNAKAFVLKPVADDRYQTDLFYRELMCAVKSVVLNETMPQAIDRLNESLVAIGASTGGADAIETLIKGLPPIMPPILVAQHMPPQFTKNFAERINSTSRLSVKEAEDGDLLIPGQVYISPGAYNVVLRNSVGRHYIVLEEPKNAKVACPNIDTLFQAVASGYGEKALGILLTGMGRDGAEGLKAMHDAGAMTFGQDESSSVVYGMPKAAFQLGAVDMQLSPAAMSPQCVKWVSKRCG